MHQLTRTEKTLETIFAHHYAIAFYRQTADKDVSHLPFTCLNFHSVYDGFAYYEKETATELYSFLKELSGQDPDVFTVPVVMKLGLHFYQQYQPMDEVFDETELSVLYDWMLRDRTPQPSKENLILADLFSHFPSVDDIYDNVADGITDYRYQEAEEFLQKVRFAWEKVWNLNCFHADDDGESDVYFHGTYEDIMELLEIHEGDHYLITNATKGGFSCIN